MSKKMTGFPVDILLSVWVGLCVLIIMSQIWLERRVEQADENCYAMMFGGEYLVQRGLCFFPLL
jgi:hypothetical protein